MPKEDASRQLVISFDHDLLITEQLDKGTFTTQVEITIPEEHSRWEKASSLIQDISSQQVENLAFVIKYSEKTPVAKLAELKQSTLSPFLLVLSGRHANIKQLREDAAQARSFGIRNFLAVTGNLPEGIQQDADGSFSVPVPEYTDSVDALAALTDPQKKQSLACVMNPYIYVPEIVFMHYAKLIKKLDAGAQFIISQAGWDIKKAQELQWYLQMREKFIPVIARLRLISPDEAGALGNGPLEPGINIPVPIAAKLMRLRENPEHFWEYQNKLAALLAVGYKKIGYSGILLAGINDSKIFKQTMDSINDLDKSITSYNDWRQQWLAFHEDSSIDPPPTLHSAGMPYYLFDNLLAQDKPFYKRDEVKVSTTSFTKPKQWELFKAKFINPNAQGILVKVARLIFKPDERLIPCYGLDNAACPKRLVSGPCGGARTDGWCEANHATCYFNDIARIAASRFELAMLEE
ncbi:MAG: methylenetetrahydrofolate reductase C-terminal domain-containing protein [Victivallales bacterium]|nr:methylenetetrahydrofolate reductase C-terminal domain-containing protein [Victivallales bacterium]